MTPRPYAVQVTFGSARRVAWLRAPHRGVRQPLGHRLTMDPREAARFATITEAGDYGDQWGGEHEWVVVDLLPSLGLRRAG